eukprot:jgi/Mesvir1/750/Mv17351-RA.1
MNELEMSPDLEDALREAEQNCKAKRIAASSPGPLKDANEGKQAEARAKQPRLNMPGGPGHQFRNGPPVHPPAVERQIVQVAMPTVVSMAAVPQQPGGVLGMPSHQDFRRCQEEALLALEPADVHDARGIKFIKRSGWRKIASLFGVSLEIRKIDSTFDDGGCVIRSECLVRASLANGRFSDGYGSCDRREKKFTKVNSDVPATAETRAKNRAIQDLIGVGQTKRLMEDY